MGQVTGGRLSAKTRMKYRFSRPYGYLEPAVTVRSLSYNLERGREGRGLSVLVPTYSLDSGLFAERQATVFGYPFTHTLEPRARYVYTPYRAEQNNNPLFDTSESLFSYASLWRDDRFSGSDRVGDTHHLSLGLSSRILGSAGSEYLRASVGQMLFFEDRRVQAGPPVVGGVSYDEQTSPVAAQLSWKVMKNLRLSQDWIYNTHDRDQKRGASEAYSTTLQYRPDSDRVFNVSHRFRQQPDRIKKDGQGVSTGRLVSGDIEQTDVSAVWPVYRGWKMFARWNYDHTNKRRLDRALGLERDGCCYRIRLIYRRWIDLQEDVDLARASNDFFLQLTLKGLGGMGRSAHPLLSQISGYDDH